MHISLKMHISSSYPSEYIEAHNPAIIEYVLIPVSQPTCLFENIIASNNLTNKQLSN